MTTNTITATHIETETIQQHEATRHWFKVSGHSDGFDLDLDGEYCWHIENGQVSILDEDGSPLTDGDGETEAVRQAVEPHIEAL